MVSLKELLDQSGAKFEQIVSSLKQDKDELGPEHFATRVQEILETFREMRESLQPVHHHFNGLDLERIPELGIYSQESLNSQGPEKETKLVKTVSSRNRLEADNYEYQEVLLSYQVKHMEKIWEWFNNDRVGTIAMVGETGMGKTWMARQLMDRAIAANLFDVVIWLDSSQRSLLEAQEHIVDQLGLSITRKPNEKNYDYEDLMEEVALALGKKRYLLIINDFVYDDTILEDFGFSDPWRPVNSNKVLISGPNEYIDDIDKDKSCKVEPLENDEAWLLFMGINGLDLYSPYIHEIAEPFVNSFEGVPSKIVSSGGDAAELTNRVCDLLNSGNMDVIEGIEFCKYLSEGNRIKVKDFIPWWIANISVDDDCMGLEEAYEKAHHILTKLSDSPYLEHDETQVWVIINEKNFKSTDSDIARANTEYLLLYGKQGCLPRTIPDLFFKEMQKLRTLVIRNAGIFSLPESLSNLRNLEVLIIRGCSSLKNLDTIRGLWNLQRLCLSGASSLKEIPDDMFKNINKIEVLDLSKNPLKELPLSFSNLFFIKTLILQGCSQLQSIPSMNAFDKLYLLDLSGATALTSIPDTVYSITTLDLSGTLIDSLPSPSNLESLEKLNLRGCTKITTMSHPDEYKSLTVLNLSGANSFREFQGQTFTYASFASKIDLSGTLISQVPPFVDFDEVTMLLLQNCFHLEKMPPLDFGLTALDLSGSIAFENFHDASLPDQLRYLDLSRTQIGKLPMLSKHSGMVRLILRECGLLEELPHLELQRLQVLDLSGSTKFKTFKDDSFNKLRKLKTLNLSETQVANLPTLSQCSELRQLILRKCLKLEELPHLNTLDKLEILDLSGAISFKQFKDESFGKKEELRELNLSETQVVQIPSLSECHNLRNLILGGCSKLVMVPNLETLSRLIVLDLSGAISLTEFYYQSIGLKYGYVQVLDISGIQVSDLSFISGCIDLRQLSLRDCPDILAMPLLDKLTRLEELDLSRTEITELSFLSGCKSLRQLLLNDCSNIQELTSLKEHTRLKVLDLSRTNIDDLSVLIEFNELSELSLSGCPNLKTLSFEGMQNLQKLDLSHNRIKLLSSSFSGIRNLQTLLLTDCSSLETLPRMEFLPKLEVLDLSCTNVRKFPNDISVLARLTLHQKVQFGTVINRAKTVLARF